MAAWQRWMFAVIGAALIILLFCGIVYLMHEARYSGRYVLNMKAPANALGLFPADYA